MKDDFKKRLQDIDDEITKVKELVDQGWIFDGGILDEEEALELPKKKKEKEAFLKAKATEKFPHLVKKVQELDVAFQGLTLFLDEAREKLEGLEEDIDDIESLQEELDERKEKLNC